MGDVAISIPFWLELAACLTGGLSGAMSAVRARYDLTGCLIIAFVTGLGGGITRDLLLQDVGIYAFQNPSLIVCTLIGGIIVFYFGRLATYLDPIVDLLDNTSVAIWAIIGAGKSLNAGVGIIPSILLGTITAIGGGIMRDVFMNRSPEAFQAGTLYGSAAAIGCTFYVLMRHFAIFPELAGPICAVIVIGIRYCSLAFGWRTRPAHDYSDAAIKVVAKPMKFIAKKAHVPIGKTTRDRGGTRISKIRHHGTRLYRRLSGRWLQDQTAPSLLDSANSDGAETDCVHWVDAPPEADVPPADKSDRIFVDREELHRIMDNAAAKSAEPTEPAKPADPFEPRS